MPTVPTMPRLIEDWRPRRSPRPLLASPRPREAPPTRMAVVLNPAARSSGVAAARLKEAAAAAGLEAVRFWPTTVEDCGVGQTRQALEWGADLIVAAGGDGTTRLVAGAMADSGATLGVVPIGSANLFARNLGLQPGAIRTSVRLALHGLVARIDLGEVTCAVDSEPSKAQPMLVVAGIGRDAQAVEQVRGALKRAAGWLAYAESGARRMLAPPLPMRVELDGRVSTTRAWTVLAANCPQVMDHVVAFPRVRLDNGHLEVLRLALDSPLSWPAVAAKGLLHFEANPAPLLYNRVSRLRVRPETPLPVQIDGDVVPRVSEVSVTIRPGALRVAMPAPRCGPGTAEDSRWRHLRSL